jgi:hypothetical protein
MAMVAEGAEVGEDAEELALVSPESARAPTRGSTTTCPITESETQ